MLAFLDSKEIRRAELAANDSVQSLTFSDAAGKTRTLLLAFEGMGSFLTLTGTDEGNGVRLKAGIGGGLLAPSPSVEVSDKEGFKSVIGAAALVTPVTGETHNLRTELFELPVSADLRLVGKKLANCRPHGDVSQRGGVSGLNAARIFR